MGIRVGALDASVSSEREARVGEGRVVVLSGAEDARDRDAGRGRDRGRVYWQGCHVGRRV